MILDQLKNNPNNPRTITKDDFERLLKSIRTFPKMMELRPIIYDENFVVLGGNQRLRALNELKNEIEIKDSWFKSVSDLTEEEKKEFIVKDNIANGEWDYDALANEWSDLPLGEWGLDMAGWEEEKEITEDEAPEVSTEPAISKLGEVYQLGRHRLMCGDSTKIEDVEKLMDGNKADMVFTDPPYNFETQGGGVFQNSRQMNQVKENGVNTFDVTKLFPLAKTHVYFHNKSLIGDYIELSKLWKLSYDLAIYKKQGLPNYNGHLMTDIEYIAIIGKLDPNKGFELEMYSKVFNGKKDSDNELSYSKPVELCSKFIKLYSKDTVLDLFGGSGSTLIACEQLDRTCYMMELDEKYCDVIRKRYAKFINKEDEWQEITPKI